PLLLFSRRCARWALGPGLSASLVLETMTPAGGRFVIRLDGVVRTLRDRLIAAIVTFAMVTPSLAQPLPQAKPVGPGGSCPYGYTSSGSRCVEATATAAPDSGGYDLHLENVPVATLAKVILGDILGVGYIIDPRVQGTVSLASGRPVP